MLVSSFEEVVTVAKGTAALSSVAVLLPVSVFIRISHNSSGLASCDFILVPIPIVVIVG